MRVIPTEIAGAFLVTFETHSDERGRFQPLFRKRDFQEHGLLCNFVEQGRAMNLYDGTIRGLHYQVAPCTQVKLVRCTQGAIMDMIVDLRPESPTYLKSAMILLTAIHGTLLYVPENVAHGYQTLTAGTEVEYLMTGPYCPEHMRGVRWNDPLFGIELKRPVTCIHPRDRDYEDYRLRHG